MSKKRVIDALASSIKNYHEYVGGNEIKKNITKKRVFNQGEFYTKFQNYFMKFIPYSSEKSDKVRPREYKDNSKYLRDNSNKYYNIENWSGYQQMWKDPLEIHPKYKFCFDAAFKSQERKLSEY